METLLGILLAILWLGAWFALGVLGLIGGVLWIRLLSYRITETHLELSFAGLTMRKIPVSDITSIELYDRPTTLLPCVLYNVMGAFQPWKRGGFLFWEAGVIVSTGPAVAVFRARGRGIVLTPADPEGFVKQLSAVIRSAT